MSFTVKYPRKHCTKDYKFKLNIHMEDICKKASRKLNALARLTPKMGLSKCQLLINAFFKSQFNHCALISMNCNQSLNKINH